SKLLPVFRRHLDRLSGIEPFEEEILKALLGQALLVTAKKLAEVLAHGAIPFCRALFGELPERLRQRNVHGCHGLLRLWVHETSLPRMAAYWQYMPGPNWPRAGTDFGLGGAGPIPGTLAMTRAALNPGLPRASVHDSLDAALDPSSFVELSGWA